MFWTNCMEFDSFCDLQTPFLISVPPILKLNTVKQCLCRGLEGTEILDNINLLNCHSFMCTIDEYVNNIRNQI